MVFAWMGLIVIVLFHLPDLSRLGWGEKLAFAGMWTISAVYATLFAAEVYLPNLTEVLSFLLTDIYRWLGIN